MSKIDPGFGNQPYIFFSYAHDNTQKPLQILNILKEEGFRVWSDEGLQAGDKYNSIIDTRIRNCSVFMPILTKEYCESDYCCQELLYALESEKKPIVPIYLEHPSSLKDKMPPGLGLWVAGKSGIVFVDPEDVSLFRKRIHETIVLSSCNQISVNHVQTEAADSVYTGRIYERADRMYYKINKPMLIFSPYRLTEEMFSSNFSDAAAYKAKVADLIRASLDVPDPRDNLAIQQLQMYAKDSEYKFSQEAEKKILKNLEDLFYFMNESRQRQLQKGDTYYSSMVFHLIQVMNQVSAVCLLSPGQLIPLCVASYLTGMGNDRKREYLELAEFVSKHKEFETNYMHSYAWPVCNLVSLMKRKELTNVEERIWIQSEVIRYIVFLIMMEKLICSWVDGRPVEFSHPEAAKMVGALRTHLLYHVQILAKKGIYMPQDIQKEIYRRYIEST